MWAIAVAVVDGLLLIVVMSLVGLWVGSQLGIWRLHPTGREASGVTRAAWPERP